MGCEKSVEIQNILSEEEISEGWKLLFDGKTTRGWHLYNKGNVPSAWMVKDGVLSCYPYTFEVKQGDLITDETFRNFDLKFEWKVSEAGNSGVFINVQESKEYPTAWATGPEYQLIDNRDIGKNSFLYADSTRWAACLYGIKPNLNKPTVEPAGSWNYSRILQKDGKITFWLNGVITAEQDLADPSWSKLIAQSELSDYIHFGKFKEGHIGLQYWSKGVSFRNVKIREL